MPKMTLKTILALSAIGAIAVPVAAQITTITEPVNVPTRSVDADFVVADINQDGGLDRDEFVTFAVIKSDAGDEDFRAVVSTGQFDKDFATHDHDADGQISAAEIGHILPDAAVDTEIEADSEPELADEIIDETVSEPVISEPEGVLISPEAYETPDADIDGSESDDK